MDFYPDTSTSSGSDAFEEALRICANDPMEAYNFGSLVAFSV